MSKSDKKQKSNLEQLLDESDFQQFIELKKRFGNDQIHPTEKNSVELENYISDYSAWLKNGKPEPKFELPKNESRIEKIYRVYVNQEEWLVYNTDTEERGIVHTPVYEMQVVNGERRSTSRIIGQEISYNIRWDLDLAKKLVAKSLKDTRVPQFYVKTAIHNIFVNSEQILVPNIVELLKEITPTSNPRPML